MHVPSLISRKRDRGSLSPDEITRLVTGLTNGEVPDYQWAALAMAICLNGMSARGTPGLDARVAGWDIGSPAWEASVFSTPSDPNDPGGQIIGPDAGTA